MLAHSPRGRNARAPSHVQKLSGLQRPAPLAVSTNNRNADPAAHNLGLTALDYLVLLVDDLSFENNEFIELIEKAQEKAKSRGVQVIFLVVGASRRPNYIQTRFPRSPTFYLSEAFGEKDLQGFRDYIAQDMKGGAKQD